MLVAAAVLVCKANVGTPEAGLPTVPVPRYQTFVIGFDANVAEEVSVRLDPCVTIRLFVRLPANPGCVRM